MSPKHSTDTDWDTATAVRLLHRRRGWIWTLAVGVVAWLVVAVVFASLTDNGSGGAAAEVTTVLVLLLTAVVVIALIAAIVDTVKLTRRHTDVRARAAGLATHHPVRAQAYRYPPKHRFSWGFGWIMLLIVLGLGVAAMPGLVDGVAFVTGAEKSVTFVPVSHATYCRRSGCSTETDGYLETPGHPGVNWPGKVPLGVPFQVRQPLMNWGFGSTLNENEAEATGSIIGGVILDGASLLVLFFGYRLLRNWLRHRQMAAAAEQTRAASSVMG